MQVNEEELIKEILNDIKQNGDHFQIDEHCKCIWYSRYVSSGCYDSVFSYTITNAHLILNKRTKQEQITIDLADPNSFKKAGKVISKAINKMQTNRDEYEFWNKEAKRPGTIHIKRKQMN